MLFPAACRVPADAPAVPVIDLIRAFHDAEKRPPAGFALTAYLAHDIVRPSIVAPVPSRLTVPLPLPARAALRVAITTDAPDPSASVRFRIGISDARVYEGLEDLVVSGGNPAWIQVRTDLSAYAGFKWSLFYRPDRTTWRLVLATDPGAGTGARGVWGAPVIVTDPASARDYLRRRYPLSAVR